MPRGFSEEERGAIRARLQAAARRLLASYGMRKTSVEDLTAGAGISKGAFYLFYESKELLFFEVLQQFEAEYQAELMGALGPPELPPRERLRSFIGRAMAAWRTHPLFRHFGRDDYELLLRRLPAAAVAQGIRDDEAFAARLIAAWAAAGLAIGATPQLLSGMLRALFFVSLHADEFDPQVYPAIIERLTDLIAADLAAA